MFVVFNMYHKPQRKRAWSFWSYKEVLEVSHLKLFAFDAFPLLSEPKFAVPPPMKAISKEVTHLFLFPFAGGACGRGWSLVRNCAMVTDYDCWRDPGKAVNVAAVLEVMKNNVGNVLRASWSVPWRCLPRCVGAKMSRPMRRRPKAASCIEEEEATFSFSPQIKLGIKRNST